DYYCQSFDNSSFVF
nr:immunoglobulin light chain junction region [Macaca mulatta]